MYRYLSIIVLLIPLIGYSVNDNQIDSLHNKLNKVNDSAQMAKILASLLFP